MAVAPNGRPALTEGPPAQLAGLWRRVLASVIDLVVLGALFVEAKRRAPLVWDWIRYHELLAMVTLIGFGPILTSAAMVALFGVTPGMWAMSIKVVDEWGDSPGWRAAFVRTAVFFWPWMLFLVSFAHPTIVGAAIAEPRLFTTARVCFALWQVAILVSIQTDPGNQGWHDRPAGTWVVRTRWVWSRG